MPYEDPLEAALRALTGVEWRKRDATFEARTNHTDAIDMQEQLAEYDITVSAEVSTMRSGRYIVTIPLTDTVRIQKAVQAAKVEVKPHRRKWHN